MWEADKIYFRGSSGYTKAYQGSELVWEIQSIDFTKKYWWNSTQAYNFVLPTRWNNSYRLEIDQYFTQKFGLFEAKNMLLHKSNVSSIPSDSPFEVFYTFNYYFDLHFPNSTTAATVNTGDFDSRVSVKNLTKVIDVNTEYTFKYFATPTHYYDIVKDGEVICETTKNKKGNKQYCTTEDYKMYVSTFYSKAGWCYVSDIRVYDDNNTLIHNYQLYPNPNNNDAYEYLDRVTNIWYPVVNSPVSNINVTDR